MDELLNDFFKMQSELHEKFGYQQQYRVFPMVDHRDLYWRLFENEKGGGRVISAKKVDDFLTEEYWEDTIYTQRHLTKWVYRTETHTMILVDTGCDLNVYLAVFDNTKEVKEVTLAS